MDPGEGLEEKPGQVRGATAWGGRSCRGRNPELLGGMAEAGGLHTEGVCGRFPTLYRILKEVSVCVQRYQQGKWSRGKGYRCGVRLRALAGQPAEVLRSDI